MMLIETEHDKHNKLVRELERTIEKAVLIRKIDAKSQESIDATPAQLEQIKLQLTAYRERLRLLEEE